MSICKTCKWWQLPEGDDYWGSEEMITPRVHPDVPLPVEFGVRYCNNPKIGFCERPDEPNVASVADGSYYMANLITAENFGCVLHEAGVPTAEERKRVE